MISLNESGNDADKKSLYIILDLGIMKNLNALY